jgi:hypothetical protein
LRKNDFATKNFGKKNISTKMFFIQTISGEMILQTKKISAKKFLDQIFFHPNCFRGNDFAIKNFRPK